MRKACLSASLRPFTALHTIALPCTLAAAAVFTHGAHAQWANFINDTANRMPVGAGLNTAALTTADPEEKDYAWGDLDNDGFIDLVCVRKVPFTNPGGKRNVLFMNEGGVLVDRTAQFANTALGVPGAQGVSQGMLDLTNDRDVVIADVNNDGWLDVITATTLSDGLPRYISHPRVYINMGEVGGVWQGLRYEYHRIPQLFSVVNGTPQAPRFCSVAVGDVTGDGYPDLYFGDYDGGFNSTEPPENDVDNVFMVNGGAANPGVFINASVTNFPVNFNYPGVGSQSFNWAKFGAASVIADMNGDGINDIVKQTSLQAPVHVAVMTNNPSNVGIFSQYKIVYSGAAYFVSAGDLNNDGRLDLVMSDDAADRYLLNTGNDAQGQPNFTSFTFQYGSGQDDGFASQSVIIDLDNDGFNDVLISDVDVDEITAACDARRLHIFQNLGDVPNVTLREASPSIIPTAMLRGTHNVAAFDINNDGWIDLVLGRCYSTEVWMNAGALLRVDSPPAWVNPTTGTAFDVTLSASEIAPVVPGSANLMVSVNGGSFTAIPLVHNGGSDYTANLPAGACGDELRFYVTAQAGSATLNEPAGAPAATFIAIRATDLVTLIDEAFEDNVRGWSVQNVNLTAGAWEAVVPIGTVFSGQQAAPSEDATPDPGVKAFVTQNGVVGGAAGNSDVDGGPTHLTSPALDASNGQFRVSYAYWFYTSDFTADTLTVAVSNDNGSNWTTVRTYTQRSNGWVRDAFNIGDFVTPTSQVRVRFSAIDGLPGSIVEAGLDDFRFEQFSCSEPCPADVNGDSNVNVTDLLAVIGAWGATGSNPADINGDEIVNVSDLLAVIGAWGPCP